VERLRYVVVGALLDRLHGAGDVAKRSDQDDRRRLRLRLKRGQHVHAAGAVAEPHVEDDEVVRALARAPDRLVARGERLDLVALAAHDLFEQLASDAIVLANEYWGAAHDAWRSLAVSARGKMMVKVEPRPGALSTVIRPPRAVASSRQ